MNPLLCPRCQTPLRERERETGAQDVVVMDTCPACGGLWLDKGELEKLSQSEERYYASGRPEDYRRDHYREDRRGNRDRDDDDDDDGYLGRGGGGGFLGNLFGGMGRGD